MLEWAVRKFLLILLVAILPLQYAWAAAAAYCGHEAGGEPASTQHFGHHSHQHKGDDGAPSDTFDTSGTATASHAQADQPDHPDQDPPKSGKIHADCAVCQFAVHAPLPVGAAVLPETALSGYPPAHALLFSSYIAEGPKGPDWHRAA